MKDNFVNSMLGEGGKISHKRFMSVLLAFVASAISLWYSYKVPDKIPVILTPILVFICVMSGVATVAQIISLVKGTPPPKEDKPNSETTEN
jgi:hypothetical protein